MKVSQYFSKWALTLPVGHLKFSKYEGQRLNYNKRKICDEKNYKIGISIVNLSNKVGVIMFESLLSGKL